MQKAIFRLTLVTMVAMILAGCASQQAGKMQTVQEPPEWMLKAEDRQADMDQQAPRNLDPVIAAATEAIKGNPSDVAAYMRRGDAYFKMGEFEKALADFTAAIYMEPSNEKAYFYRGIALARQGKSKSALADLNKVIEFSTNYPVMAYLQRGEILGKLGNQDRAITDFNRVLEAKPSFWQARLLRGIAYEKSEEYMRAIEDYEKAIELNPEAHQAYNNLAWLLATMPEDEYRNGSRAVMLAQKAYTLNPHVYTLDTLAAAYAENGQFREAVATQRRAIDRLRETGNLELEQVMQSHLDLYKKGKPWRQFGPVLVP